MRVLLLLLSLSILLRSSCADDHGVLLPAFILHLEYLRAIVASIRDKDISLVVNADIGRIAKLSLLPSHFQLTPLEGAVSCKQHDTATILINHIDMFPINGKCCWETDVFFQPLHEQRKSLGILCR